MRITTVFRELLDVTSAFVRDVRFEADGLVVAVVPTWRKPRCGQCEEVCPGYDHRSPRRWRHLNFGATKVWLEYAPRRVRCPNCGVRTENVPWAPRRGRFTWAFEELAAYLAQATDRTKVSDLLGVSWNTIGAIVERVVDRKLDPARLTGLRRIGIDDFSYRKRHRYLTVIVDHDRRRVVWAGPGRTAKALDAFFDALGEEGCQLLECATIDMAGGYIKALAERVPNAQIVFDRFHVQRLISAAVDAVRREQLRETRGTDEGRELFRSRFALLKNPWNLHRRERQKLRELQRTNARIYRAYLLKETLVQVLNYRQPHRIRRGIKEWLAWASRSRLRPFVIAARTIRKYLDGVLAYATERLTNGIVEGFNNKLRTIARRAYGFHSTPPLVSMLFLCCGGIVLSPPLPT